MIRASAFLLLFLTASLYSQHPDSRLEALYPGISSQIDRIGKLEPDLASPSNRSALADYLQSNDPELRKGMKLILESELQSTVVGISKKLVVDGSDQDWYGYTSLDWEIYKTIFYTEDKPDLEIKVTKKDLSQEQLDKINERVLQFCSMASEEDDDYILSRDYERE
jgi:hypothetical protein